MSASRILTDPHRQHESALGKTASEAPESHPRNSRAPHPTPSRKPAQNRSQGPKTQSPDVRFINRLIPGGLRPFQRDFLGELFSLGLDGRRRYTSALWGLPRGNGKTEISAGVALDMLAGPGNRHQGEVIICAASRDQAMQAYTAARRMAQAAPELEDRLKIQPGYKRILDASTDSVLQVVSAEGRLQHGLRPTCVIFDELWAQNDRRLWEAMVGGLAKREDTLLLSISTAGYDAESLLAEECRRGEDGEDPRFLYRWQGLARSDPSDYQSPATWLKANPALRCRDPFLPRTGLEDAVRRMRESEFRRWHLNQWVDVEEIWISGELWAACATTPVAGDDVMWVLGLDGSATGDVTALVAVSVEDKPHIEVVAYWQPSTEEPVPVLDVEEAIKVACKERQVVSIVADPFRWTRSLQVLSGESFPVLEYPQQPGRLAPATASFYEATLNKALTHDGHPELARHISHAVIKQDPRGVRITKESKKSPRRIDLAMAAIMAFDRAKELTAKTVQFW
jgi:phage terminase large subunit-like protein